MRTIRNFFIFIILILTLAVCKPAHAQIATPTPDPCNPDAPLSTPCPVHYDTTNVVIPQEQTWVSSLVNSVASLLGKKEIEWNGSLRPSDDTYGIGSKKFTDLGKQLQQASENELKPADLQAITTPDLQPKPFTMTSVVCVKDPQTGAVTQISSADRIESKDIPSLKEAIQASRELGQYVTGYTSGQNYNLKNIVVNPNSAACDTPASGQTIEQTAISTQNQISYSGKSIVTIIQDFISNISGLFQAKVTATAEVQGKGLTPWMHYVVCLVGGCTSGDIASVAYDPHKDQLVRAGGAVAAMYKPAAIDDTYKSDLNAANPNQQWSISGTANATSKVLGDQNVTAKAVNFGEARVEAAGTYMNCTLSPAGIQGPECNTNWTNANAACGGTTLPDLSSIKDASCKLCSPDKISSYIDDQNSVPGGKLPPTMVKILEKAADTFHVPVGVMLGVLYHEGAFSAGRYQWTEENVKKWSYCGGSMPLCDKTQTSKAQMPFGFIPYWFYGGSGESAQWTAVQKIDPSRNTKDKVSPCNFLDASFALARTLSIWYATRNPDTVQHNVYQCLGHTLIDTHTLPSSCSAWNDDRVAEAYIGHGGYCPEPGKHTIRPEMPDNDPFIQRTITRFHAFSCGGQ